MVTLVLAKLISDICNTAAMLPQSPGLTNLFQRKNKRGEIVGFAWAVQKHHISDFLLQILNLKTPRNLSEDLIHSNCYLWTL